MGYIDQAMNTASGATPAQTLASAMPSETPANSMDPSHDDVSLAHIRANRERDESHFISMAIVAVIVLAVWGLFTMLHAMPFRKARAQSRVEMPSGISSTSSTSKIP
jgi:hypothetical protein